MQRQVTERSSQKWEATPVSGLYRDGELSHAKTVLKPVTSSPYRKLSQIELIRDLKTNQVTVTLRASAQAREDGLLENIAAIFKNNAVIKEENLKEKSLFPMTIPVLQITVPYDKVNGVLQAANQFEDDLCKMTPQTTQQLAESISDNAVNYLMADFKRFFK